MRHLWSLACRRYILDSDSRMLTIVDVVDSVKVQQKLPDSKTIRVRVDLFFLTTFWRDREEAGWAAEVKADIRAPQGALQHLRLVNLSAEDTKEPGNFRVAFHVDNIEFHGDGIYNLELRLLGKDSKKWKRVSSYPIIVNFDPAFATAPARPSGQTPFAPLKSS